MLIKPANFDPAKKYPLLCIIHGGPDRHRPAGAAGARRALLPVRHLGGPRRADPQGQLSRQRGLRREVPAAQRAQPRRRRRLGRAVRSRAPDRERLGRSGKGRLHGMEPGRVHLRLPDDLVRQVRRRSPLAPASRTGRRITTTPTSRRSPSSTSAKIRPTIRRSTSRPRR